ncbi:Acyl-CoA dehydrogenase/oxidase domain protein [Candidatus Burkholderia humilis]|nr:Acyl-CoA dehydrogenase/oxidase domain protein [Candidatus Burkholderia humilis]
MLTNAQTEGAATVSALREFLARTPRPSCMRSDAAQTGRMLRALIDAQLDRLPLPGSGDTHARWQALGAVAGFDLSLVRLYEGHTDALAILAELDGAPPEPGTSWGVWAAEPPNARLLATGDSGTGALRLQGTKAWCSGAASLTHALVTTWNERDESVLVAVDLRQPGVKVTDSGWSAVGMRASASVDVLFDDVPARRIGAPRAYLERPGFWQGSAGIAACWHGAAASIANFVVRNVRDAHQSERPADP